MDKQDNRSVPDVSGMNIEHELVDLWNACTEQQRIRFMIRLCKKYPQTACNVISSIGECCYAGSDTGDSK
jgi:hypothetical protein